MSKQFFIVTIEDAPETRWIKQEFLPEKLSRAVEGVVSGATEGKIPRVTVSLQHVEPTKDEVRRIHAAARAVHPEAKPCRCEICKPPLSDSEISTLAENA